MNADFDDIKKVLKENYSMQQIHGSQKISSPEIFAWETKFQVNFSNNLKRYFQEIGIFQFDWSFYECLDSEMFYVHFLTDDFIDILKNEGVPYDEIKVFESDYNFKSKCFDYAISDEWTITVNKIYEDLGKDDSCLEIGVCLFDDTYNCSSYLMLTGKNKDYIVNVFGNDSYRKEDYFWNYLLKDKR